jgi:predicted Zn-dependent peptidase
MVDSKLVKCIVIVIALCFLFVQFQLHPDIFALDKDSPTWKHAPGKVHIDNNLSFVFHRDISSEITILRIFIRGGKKAEPENKKGLAFLTTRLCVEIPNQSGVRKLMDLGSSFFTRVEGDYSIITVKCLSGKLVDTLHILAPILRKPLISTLRINHIKKYMRHRQKSEEDDSDQLMEREYFNLFFGNSGYGGSIFGDSESLKQIKKKDIGDFYKKWFNLSNMVITVSSDLKKSTIKEIIKKSFHTLPPGKKECPLPPIKKMATFMAEERERFLKKDKIQSLVSLGVMLPGITPHNFTCSYMLENLLGGDIGSKLWPLRAVKNLAYRLRIKVTRMKDAGILMVYLDTHKSREKRASQALKQVMTDIYKKGVTKNEFSFAAIRSKASFLRSNETKEIRTFNLGFFESIGPGFPFLEDFFSYVDRMTPGELNTYIKEVLKPDHLVSIIIGPPEN